MVTDRNSLEPSACTVAVADVEFVCCVAIVVNQLTKTSPAESAERNALDTAPAPTSTFMQMSACITRLYDFDAEKQIYVSLPAFDSSLKIGQFIASFKVQVRNQPKGVVLLLLDSGSTCLLSPCDHHFPVKLKCDIHINGVGGAKVDIMSPQVRATFK